MCDRCFTKHSWFKRLNYKKGKTVLDAYIEIVNESNRKPNILWVDQGREFYNKLMQEWLDNNECKFMKTLKAKIYKKYGN